MKKTHLIWTIVALSVGLTACSNAQDTNNAAKQETTTETVAEQTTAAGETTAEAADTIARKLPDDWMDQVIAGQETQLTDSELERIEKAAKDIKPETTNYLALPESEAVFIGEVDGFLLWGTNGINAMVVKTPDGKYIWMNAPYVSTHMNLPKMMVTDLDGDGKDELTIHTFVLHGTGYLEELMYVVDQVDGMWYAYLMTPQWYMDELHKRADNRIEGKQVVLNIDDKATDYVMDTDGDSSAYFELQAYITLSISDKKIIMENQPVGLSTANPIGYWIDGISLEITIEYLGAGEFKMDKIEVIKK